jgi:hypothetical protein
MVDVDVACGDRHETYYDKSAHKSGVSSDKCQGMAPMKLDSNDISVPCRIAARVVRLLQPALQTLRHLRFLLLLRLPLLHLRRLR